MAGLLDGRVVAITGAGRGIGAGIARVLASEGAKLVVNDLGVSLTGENPNTSPAETTVNRIKDAGGEAVASGNDVADFDSAGELIQQAIQTYGKLDVVVNVAGILRDRMIFNLSPEDWDAVIRVHLRGTYNLSRHASAYWREQRNPDGHYRLITFTSGSGLHGTPGQPNYSAAKAGIVGFTYSTAKALAKYGVTVNAVSPAAQTRMGDSIPDQSSRPAALADPTNNEMAPENVGPAVAYLASEQSDWCTGQVIRAAGYRIGIYGTPRVISEVVSPGPWDLATAFHMIEAAFKPVAMNNPYASAGIGPLPVRS